MNRDIVAGGIEDAGQVAELVRLSCRMGQGFHFARPMQAEELGRYLDARRALPAAKPTILAV
ncbi:MAG TPA: hypothetical protein VI434_08170 [Candidatus Dormibacteraeota bacterium]